jgi:hypothetical protein
MRILETTKAFLVAAWLHGLAAFLVIAAGGLTGGAAFVLALWLVASTFRAFALPPLRELLGLARPPRLRLPLLRALGLLGLALALLLGLSTLASRAAGLPPLPAEPFTIAVLLEASCALVGGGGSILARLIRAFGRRRTPPPAGRAPGASE